MKKIQMLIIVVVSMLFANAVIAGATECVRTNDNLHCVMKIDAQVVEVDFKMPDCVETVKHQANVIDDLRYEIRMIQDENLELVIENLRLKEMLQQSNKKYERAKVAIKALVQLK